MALLAATPAGTLTASAHRLGAAAVLVLSGRLDPAEPLTAGTAVERALMAVDSCLVPRPHAVVVDLEHVDVSRVVVGLLGLVRRRTARAGVPLALTALSPGGRAMLEAARVAPLYPDFSDVGTAVAALGRSRRSPRLAAGG